MVLLFDIRSTGAQVEAIDRGLSTIGLDRFERDGLLQRDGTQLLVTEAGPPLVRFICAAFDRYYTGGEGRHSRGLWKASAVVCASGSLVSSRGDG